ncbi:MAG TPA: hypothetical protein VF651_09955, partial [Gammaproteobacteria bacterium]
VNIGGITTNGIDLATHYKLPSTSVGDFKVGLDWTFLRSFVQVVPNSASATGFTPTELAGSTTAFGGFPKQKANLSLNWNYGDFTAVWNVQYIYSMTEGCPKAGFTGGLCSNLGTSAGTSSNYIGKTVYHDWQFGYHLDGWNTDLTFGIRNVFDKQPPTALTAFANSFLPAFYRVPGREFYGRVTVKF